MMTIKQAIEKVFDRCNLIGEDANIYAEMNRYKALRELDPAQQGKVYEILACRLGFMSYDKMPQVIYFEAVSHSVLHQYECASLEQYYTIYLDLKAEDPDAEILYREWSDGTVEDGDDLPDIIGA